MLSTPIVRFIVRWLVCALGLWIAANILSNNIHYSSIYVIIIAGLVLALVNTFIKPILIIMSLPAIVFTLGIFTVIINGFTVFLASELYEQLHITNFLAAIFAGMVIGLVNYLVSTIIDRDI